MVILLLHNVQGSIIKHKRTGSGNIQLVLCIPLMLCESETQQEICKHPPQAQ